MAGERDVLSVDAVTPVRYALELTPDLDRFVFAGTAAIELKVTAETTEITVNAKELHVSKASVTCSDGSVLAAQAINQDLVKSRMTFCFASAIPTGDAVLKVVFTGELNNQMAGFYRSSYTTVDGTKKTMASTQFEAIDARRCFPCWDEPNRKAVFGVTLVVDQHLTALSNMPEAEVTTEAGGKKRIRFLDSPIMSTYLLAFVVGEFDFVQATSKHGVTIRTFTPPGKSVQGKFALDCAVGALDLYDDFFGVEYPLVKLDMIAIPEFAAGAMENWGLVTYREVDLLIDPATASSKQRQRVCTVVTHELAHQWFGNLVTMDWWDDLWLNEGFACFMQTWSADLLFPDWKVWDSFPVSDQASALRLDGLKSSHPIQVPIHAAHEVEEVFDAISYCKGACVIRMVHSMIGHEAFRAGLQAYMQKHKYGNTVTKDLWSAWEVASGLKVGEMMASWTEQCGYPCVRVVSSTWSDTEVKLELEQTWFLADGSEVAADEQKSWTIPVICGGSSVTDEAAKVTLLSEATPTLTVPLTGCGEQDWVKLNFGQGSMFRVQYDEPMLRRLCHGISTKQLPPADRAALLLDALALAKANRIGPEQLLMVLAAFKEEDSGAVWDAIASSLAYLNKVFMAAGPAHDHFRTFAAGMVEKAIAPVGWDAKESDGHMTVQLRSTLIDLLAKFSTSDATVSEARKRFDAYVANPENAAACPSDYRVSVFAIVLKAGGEAEFDTVKDMYATLKNNVDKKMVLNAIGYSPSVSMKIKALDWATSGAILLQDFFYAIYSVGGSSADGTATAWQYFQDNFDKLQEMVATASPSLFGAVIAGSTSGFVTAEAADTIKAFFETHPVPQNARLVAQLVESIRGTASFAERLVASDQLRSEQYWQAL